MLSRVANCLYWMARYTERAENIARIVDVNLQLLLDFRRFQNLGNFVVGFVGHVASIPGSIRLTLLR